MNYVGPGVQLMESLMFDECVIYSDPQQVRDDVLDEETLILGPPASDDRLIYRGKCMVSPESRKDTNFVQGEGDEYRKMFLVRIPISEHGMKVGDELTIVSVGEDNDQILLDVPMRIGKVEGGTFRTSRALHVELYGQDVGAEV